MGPRLTTLVIGDDASAWAAAGFDVAGGHLDLDGVRVEFQPDAGRRGILAWGFDGVDDGSIDGILTLDRPTSDPAPASPTHPNGIGGFDHLVVMSDNLDQTRRSLGLFGFEERRTREVPGTDPVRLQVFYWAGDVIIELVGVPAEAGNRPASIWGLALTSDDIDASADTLGDRLSTPKDAVQPGRRIATLRTKDLDISVPIAIMTPHSVT